MAELPVLPLKTDAILADTTHMSPEEFGAYCRLLFVMWRHGGTLKDDDSEFANISGMPLTRWRKVKEKVMRPMTIAGGLVSQKRLTDTWMQVQEVRRKRANAADASWKNRPRAGAKAMQMHQQEQSQCNANQIPKKNTTSLEDRHSEVLEVHLQNGGSLATALPTGALREPPNENPESGEKGLAKVQYEPRSPSLTKTRAFRG